MWRVATKLKKPEIRNVALFRNRPRARRGILSVPLSARILRDNYCGLAMDPSLYKSRPASDTRHNRQKGSVVRDESQDQPRSPLIESAAATKERHQSGTGDEHACKDYSFLNYRHRPVNLNCVSTKAKNKILTAIEKAMFHPISRLPKGCEPTAPRCN